MSELTLLELIASCLFATIVLMLVATTRSQRAWKRQLEQCHEDAYELQHRYTGDPRVNDRIPR